MSLASDLIDKVQRTGAKFELTPTGFNVRCAPGSVPLETPNYEVRLQSNCSQIGVVLDSAEK